MATGSDRNAGARTRGRRRRAVQFSAITDDIVANIGRSDLSAAWIASRHGVSPSHVRRLLAADKTTFSQFVLEHRLELAHRMLIDPMLIGRTISAIAFSVGFGDISYFNRTFRRRYGVPPSEASVEGRALDDDESG